jgi:hypothetical protein
VAKQTKAAVMQLEVGEEEVDGATLPRVLLHMYRADLVTGIVEVDSAGTLLKLGTHMHQPGGWGGRSGGPARNALPARLCPEPGG